MARTGPHNPRTLDPRQDPRRPRAHDETPGLLAKLAAAVDQFGRSDTRTRSRRHGHEPQARTHVELYLSHTVLGLSVRRLAASRRRAISTTHQSIVRGRRLVARGAEARGFSDPDGSRLVMDFDEPEGWSQQAG